MKIAITVWGNRISPVFDAASTLFVAHIENRMIIKKSYISFNPTLPFDLIKLLKKMQVSVLICGAISTKPADLIVENDIKLISFVTGNALRLLNNFARKQTIEKTFMMPGCSKQYCWRYKSKKLPIPDSF
ncbi:MAG: dinitrogenase iron-molybdenum cofactor biosynthesis domain-containing protein [Desulfobacula sp.]|nr:dinitrogenase iron-molybdenum cofactor biosynthesis domain-containing protein [Desulfobacula sp.]